MTPKTFSWVPEGMQRADKHTLVSGTSARIDSCVYICGTGLANLRKGDSSAGMTAACAAYSRVATAISFCCRRISPLRALMMISHAYADLSKLLTEDRPGPIERAARHCTYPGTSHESYPVPGGSEGTCWLFCCSNRQLRWVQPFAALLTMPESAFVAECRCKITD